MKKTNLKSILAASLALAVTVALGEEIPKGWLKAGSCPKDYEVAIDREIVHNDKPSASVKNLAPKPGGFVTLMQMSKADTYRGKRVRMSGYVRSKEIKNWAGLWFRVDGPKGEPLAFDNMEKRAIKGTSDWTKCELVLDVPETAKQIAFGLLMTGPGQVWMADLNFEVVDKNVATTGAKMGESVHSEPANLDFEK